MEGRKVTIQGDPTLSRAQVSLHSMVRIIKKEGQGIMLQLQSSMAKGKGRATLILVEPASLALDLLMSDFQEVFETPVGPSSSRSKEQSISLQPRTTPISIEPYRYPHFQNMEIEKLVANMLQARIIQLSMSPYFSPMLLVRKKDGSWRFCVDYRALNKATVVNKFPIPVIEELLDELHGAKLI